MLLAGGETVGDVLVNYNVAGCSLWTPFASMRALCYSLGSFLASLPGPHC